MEEDAIDYVRKYIDTGHTVPDIALDLDRILVPLACQSFEKMGIEVARQIAAEFGAKVTLLHNGSRDLDRWAQPFEQLRLKVEKKITKQSDTALAILDEAKNGYQLLIMPSRRRAKWIDKFFINSISANIIPKIDYDVLQVFPSKGGLPGDEEIIPVFKDVGILLPRAQRDPRLLFWANSLIQTRDAKLHAYHIADLPRLTPMRVALDTKVVMKESEEFETLIGAYESIFQTSIEPRFICSHKIAITASTVLNKEKPDIAVMGQTKNIPWWKLRSLSDKILDLSDVPFIVHHQPNNR